MAIENEIKILIETFTNEEFAIIRYLIKDWGFEEIIKYTLDYDNEQKTPSVTFLVQQADLSSFAHAFFVMGMRAGIKKEKERTLAEKDLSLMEKSWSKVMGKRK